MGCWLVNESVNAHDTLTGVTEQLAVRKQGKELCKLKKKGAPIISALLRGVTQ